MVGVFCQPVDPRREHSGLYAHRQCASLTALGAIAGGGGAADLGAPCQNVGFRGRGLGSRRSANPGRATPPDPQIPARAAQRKRAGRATDRGQCGHAAHRPPRVTRISTRRGWSATSRWANEAGTTPVIVLTKSDQAKDPARYQQQAEALQRDLVAVTLNAKAANAIDTLEPWCGAGQTVALVGSSGVGKSTLLNTLAGKSDDAAQPTQGIREDDAKGRHTHHLALAACDCGGRLGDRHAGNARAAGQRLGGRSGHAVCRDYRACAQLSFSRLHP